MDLNSSGSQKMPLNKTILICQCCFYSLFLCFHMTKINAALNMQIYKTLYKYILLMACVNMLYNGAVSSSQ